MLLEIHILHNHAPANLNRDDSGSPKTCIFGGVLRARISSQAMKRSIRTSAVFRDAVKTLGSRTRQLPEIVRQKFVEEGYDSAMAEAAAFVASSLGKKDPKPEKKSKQGEILTAQTMFLSPDDIALVTEALLERAAGAKSPKDIEKIDAKAIQDVLEQRIRKVTPDIALFGRMITDRSFRDVESAIQTAHAISTHRVDPEIDYFTAVDDLLKRDAEKESDAGADMIGDVEFNSACFYKYFSIDVDGLIDNLTGKRIGRQNDIITDDEVEEARATAASLIRAFVQAACLVSPTGKQNTFASHTKPSLVLIEARPHSAPVSYADAFVDPVRPDKVTGDLVTKSIDAFVKHVQVITDAFELQAEGRWLFAPSHDAVTIDGVERVARLSDLAERAAAVARRG